MKPVFHAQTAKNSTRYGQPIQSAAKSIYKRPTNAALLSFTADSRMVNVHNMPRTTLKDLSQTGWRLAGTLGALWFCAFVGHALAQDIAPPVDTIITEPAGTEEAAIDAATAREELDEIQSSITLTRERAETMRAEIAEMDGDRTKQNAALIAAAQRVKAAETETAAAEARLAELIARENNIRTRLDGADSDISNILAALQRIGRSPPPALLVNPDDALGSARSAIMITSILPQLRARADTVSADLADLLEIRQAAQAEEEGLRANLSTLLEEQLRTATLIEARKRGVARVSGALEAEEQKAEELAGRAQSLGELIEGLSENIDSVAAAADAAGEGPPDASWVNLDRDTILTALANTDRTEPAIPFAAARGFLTMPASGDIVSRFGADDGFGGIARGISVITRPDAQVVAPADGWVMYKGPYLNYGQIIILNPGNGYSILLAGLDSTNVELGQFVMMGEPVGIMGSRTIGQAVTTTTGVSRPTLYIELRDQDTPLNPTNWWADNANRTQSG